MMKRAILLMAVLAMAGCGGSSTSASDLPPGQEVSSACDATEYRHYNLEAEPVFRPAGPGARFLDSRWAG